MQYGPDQVPVSTQSIVVGPPVTGPAPVPVRTTVTVIKPPQFEPGPTLLDEQNNVPSNVPYTLAVSNEGDLVTNKATSLNFVGPGVTADDITEITGAVTVTITNTETVYNVGNVSGNVTPDVVNGTIQKFTLTGNITLNPPINIAVGQSVTLILKQGTGGLKTLTPAGSSIKFASGYYTLSTDAGDIDMLNMFYDGEFYYTTLTVSYQ
jgi:hypothetical protein